MNETTMIGSLSSPRELRVDSKAKEQPRKQANMREVWNSCDESHSRRSTESVFYINEDGPVEMLMSTALVRAERLRELLNIFLCWSSPFEFDPHEVARLCYPPICDIVALLEVLDERLKNFKEGAPEVAP